jgi:hypothetical protein
MCFLCDKYYKNSGDDQQNFQRLLKVWLDYIKNDRDMLPQIIAKLDTLIDHLQNVTENENNDYRLMEFQENILTTVFQPSMSRLSFNRKSKNIRYSRSSLYNSD